MVTYTPKDTSTCQGKKGSYSVFLKKFLTLFSLLTLLTIAGAFETPPGKGGPTKKIMAGGDFSLDFVASAPYTYDHLTGGGAFDDRTIGKNNDVVESLEGGDFTCGDIVTFLTQIVVDDGATGSQTIQLDYSFLADATGQPGVALADITGVSINYGAVSGGDGTGGTDSGMDDDGGSTATLTSETLTGPLFQAGSELHGTVEITDLEAGETVILRVDVRIACDPGSSPTGNLQADITAGRVVAPAADVIQVGNQTIPFKNVNQIIFPTCAISPSTPVCGGSTNTYTASSDVPDATYAWTITGNGTFSDGTTAKTITATGGATSTSVTVIAGASGSYTLSVSISKTGYGTQTCSQTITVNANPTVSVSAPSVCTGTMATVTATPASGTPPYSYAWTYPAGAANPGNVASFQTSVAGTYGVTVTDANGCTGTGSATLSFYANPTVSVSAPSVCTGTMATVTATPASGTPPYSYAWTYPAGAANPGNVASFQTSVAGTYGVTVTDANGCTGTGSATLSFYDNPVVAVADRTACEGEDVTFSATPNDAATYDYQWYLNNVAIAGATNPTYTVNDVTLAMNGNVYKVVVTNTATGCDGEDAGTLTVIANPTGTANGGVLTCLAPTVTLTVTGLAPAGTTIQWYGPASGGGNGPALTGEAPEVSIAGTYTAILTGPTNGCSTTLTALVTEQFNTPLPPNITVTQPDCNTATGTITATSTTPGVTYTLTGPGGPYVNTTGVFPNLIPGTYGLSVSSNSEIPTCTFNIPTPITIIEPVCGETLCTYTQGQYGTEGGMACTPDGPKTTYELIEYALDNWPDNTLYIGRPGHSLTIEMAVSAGHDDIQGVIDILPGGGKSTVLSGDAHAYDVPDSWLKNGRLTNTLLAQTITLGLNLGITTNLANFELIGGDMWLVTGDPLYDCNTESTDVEDCEYHAYQLYSSAVIQYLYDHTWNGTAFVADGSTDKKATVYELFQLASAALGGVALPSGVSLEAIAGLEDQINNIFDECQVFIGYMTYDEYISYLMAQGCEPVITSVDPSARVEASDLKIVAYPNPYNHTVSFNFTSPVTGKATLEVYDVMGRRLAVVFEGMVDAGRQKAVNYNVPSAQRVPMIYRLSVGGKSSFGKLLPGNTD